MYETENSPILGKPRINLYLLPIKLHFFFLFGAFGAVIPFLPVLAKDLNITATAVGLVYMVLAFSVMLAKPIYGAITDHFQNMKTVMIVLIFVALCTGYSMLYIPFIPQEKSNVNMSSIVNCDETSIYINISYFNSTCLATLVEDYVSDCDINYNLFSHVRNCTNFLEFFNSTSISLSYPDFPNFGVSSYGTTNASCSCDNFTSFFTISNTCLLSNNQTENISVYATFQFWTYAVLSVIFGSCTGSLFSLSDAACYEVLGDESQLYGKQRLWGTMSYGGGTLITGYLNNVFYTEFGANKYDAGFYIMACLFIIDMIILSFSKLKKTTRSLSICKDVSQMLISMEIVIFAVSVFIMGSFTALIWQYEFWFLTDLGASQLLLGLTVGIQCLVAEAPSFFASGKIIDFFGHTYCLIGSFVAFSIRFALYFCLTNPWWVLPIEILHGQTYGVFYAAMTSFANSKAPPGTEATMMGILGGLFEGLGVAMGSFLGGIGFDTLKGRYTFLTASITSAICAILLYFIHLLSRLKCNGPRATQQHVLNTRF